MPSQQAEKLQWRHPHGMDVLKRLGIIDRSNASISEGDDDLDYSIRSKKEMLTLNDEAPNGGEFMNDDSDDNEFIFDRASLLRGRHPSSDEDPGSSWFSNRRTQSMAESRRVFCCRGFLAGLAFFIVGLCMSLLGPTLENLPALSPYSGQSAATSVVSANAVGALLGIILCAGCNTLLNTFCIMMFALPLCSITTLVVPWCTTLTSATMVFMLQGVSFGLVERGCYSVFHAYWRRRHSILILFYVAFALGATMSPLIASSFFVFKPSNSSAIVAAENASSALVVRRFRSAAEADLTGNSSISVFCNDTVTANCTTIPGQNDTAISTAATVPKAKKPQVNEATDLDHKQTKTEQKEEALKKEEEKKTQAASDVKNPVATNTSASGLANVVKAGATSEITTTASTTTTTSTSTSTSTTTTTTSTATTTTPSTTTTPKTAATTEVTKTQISGSPSPSSSSTSPPPTLSEATWEQMKKEFARMNSYQLAYVTVASVSIILTVVYAMVCCFTPCRRQGTTPTGTSAGDYKLHLNGLWKSRSNVYAVLTAAGFAFVMVSLESILSSLLTVYAVATDTSLLHSSIVATSIFWFCVCLARIVASCFHGRLSQTAPVSTCLASALFATGIVVVFEYWTIVFLVSSVLGFCYGCLYPLTYCWLEQQLAPAPWFTTIWCLAGQMARLIAPFCASAAMAHRSTKDFLFALLVIALLACIVYVLMRSSVREAARLISVEQQQRVTCKVKFGGGDTLFEYHNFNNTDSIIERDGDDEVTYFDRSRDAKMANGGSAPLFELNPKKFDRH